MPCPLRLVCIVRTTTFDLCSYGTDKKRNNARLVRHVPQENTFGPKWPRHLPPRARSAEQQTRSKLLYGYDRIGGMTRDDLWESILLLHRAIKRVQESTAKKEWQKEFGVY